MSRCFAVLIPCSVDIVDVLAHTPDCCHYFGVFLCVCCVLKDKSYPDCLILFLMIYHHMKSNDVSVCSVIFVDTHACCPAWPWTWGRARTRLVWERTSAACWWRRRAGWGAAPTDWGCPCCRPSPAAVAVLQPAAAAAAGGQDGRPVEQQAGLWEPCTATQRQKVNKTLLIHPSLVWLACNSLIFIMLMHDEGPYADFIKITESFVVCADPFFFLGVCVLHFV